MPRQPVDPASYSAAMKKAASRLRTEDIRFEVMTPHQLKVDDLNLYPGRGTIYRDGDTKALPEFGLDAFVKLLQRQAGAIFLSDQD